MGLDIKNYQQIFLDTSPFIYFFEENPTYIELMSCFWDQVYQFNVNVVTSIITYVELLTLPEKQGDHLLSARYRESLTNSNNISIYPMNILVADATIKYRARYNLNTPDAIQLATAEVCGAEMILTNDQEWLKTQKPEVVLLRDLI